MSVTITKLSKAVLQSEYEELLPDGMGLSLPVPAIIKGEKCIGLFVYSVSEGVATPPSGIFYLNYPDLSVITFHNIFNEKIIVKKIPILDAAEKAEAISLLENSIEGVMTSFPSTPCNDEERNARLLYEESLQKLTGEAIEYYQFCFPDFFQI